VTLVELGLAVHTHRIPGRKETAEDARAAQLAQGPLQGIGGVAVQPNHDVSVGFQTGDIVEAANDDAVLLNPLYGGVKLENSVIADSESGLGSAKDGPEGKSCRVLFGFWSFVGQRCLGRGRVSHT
jgi:hypothetical protein